MARLIWAFFLLHLALPGRAPGLTYRWQGRMSCQPPEGLGVTGSHGREQRGEPILSRGAAPHDAPSSRWILHIWWRWNPKILCLPYPPVSDRGGCSPQLACTGTGRDPPGQANRRPQE